MKELVIYILHPVKKDMDKKAKLQSVLDKTGLTYETQPDFFSTIWKISNSIKINVIISNEIHSDWVHILCKIGPFSLFPQLNPKLVLRLNNSVIGTKISLDVDQNLICSAEIMSLGLSESYLKQQITQVVKMVTLFYDMLEKENLKWDNA